jgi:predicted signal transduction protein with EAL and GGDEF domain
VEIAQILARQVRPGDTLARVGGDEFACILTHTDHQQTKQMAMQMARAIQGTFTLGQQDITLGVSIGIASYPHDGDSFVDLLKVADIAMYQAKESGSQVVAYDASKSPYTEERLRLETRLRDAVAHESFDLQYQPIWHLGQNRLEGAEALLYWNDQNRIILASQFILLAEEIRLVEQIDKIALRKGLQQLGSWQARGLNLHLSINLSTQSIARRENIRDLIQILGDSGVDPKGLTIEITESALLRNPEEAREVLGEFKALGVRIAIDDFGSGYASLAYLRQLPLDRIKIDRSFVSQLGSDARDEKLVRAAIDLAHSLEAEVLAEGVETQEQLLWLAEQGCDLVQGYLIGQPVPISRWQSSEAITGKLNRLLTPPLDLRSIKGS